MNDENLQRLNKDNEIIPASAIIDILHIKQNTLFIGDMLATTDLP